MPHRLQLTSNAQFYRNRNPGPVQDGAINSILTAASEDIADDDLLLNSFREEVIHPGGFSYRFSAKAFPTNREVYFFSEDIFDKIYAYLVVIEIAGYIAIFKKSCPNLNDSIELNFDRIDSATLIGTFDDDFVDFQKISIRNMTVSDRAIRARSYEARDLKGILSSHAAGRSIPYFLKIKESGVLRTISANSGRVVEASERKDLNGIAAWVREQISKIEHPNDNKSFLGSFAEQIELQEVLAITRPKAVLIESSFISDQIADNQIEIFYKNKSGIVRPLNERRQRVLFETLERVHELDEHSNTFSEVRSERAKLRINRKSLSISAKSLGNIVVRDDGEEISLQKYIGKNGLFSVCFQDPQYMYFMGKCFKDSSGINEIDSILSMLKVQPGLAAATSEKGVVTVDSEYFSDGSVFNIVEQIHADDDYVFCDDLGVEWADHITLNEDSSCITFIHSKHGELTNSASKMHDVVGQGIKNLGYMYFNKDQFSKKVDSKFSELYKLQNAETQISRTRKGDYLAIADYLTRLLQNFQLLRKCVLCCSFLSKADVEREFRDLQAQRPVRGHTTQLLWIMSSFAHAARETNTVPIIYCAP
ncbi:hypothetical protein [Herbaspirillum frisingense]|uniref:hypothetical protein n=1 Tax=Herbaspirillum frisingense TaxID=92645 RepID=UPI001F1DB91A|nr:hypothetical protein [Herbaspirillum frisingense]UIN19402.1 hypothetical protein LAZ82_12895 [Herbaspirillum frisingense]